jgi:RNA recognition motif-containing protein
MMLVIRISNFPDGTDEEALEKLISKYGTVMSIRKFIFPEYAEVEMPERDARRAIKHLNGRIWREEKLEVREKFWGL